MTSARTAIMYAGHKPTALAAFELLLDPSNQIVVATANKADLDFMVVVRNLTTDFMCFLRQQDIEDFEASRILATLIALGDHREDFRAAYHRAMKLPLSQVQDLAVTTKAMEVAKAFVERGRYSQLCYDGLRPVAIMRVMLYEQLLKFLEGEFASASDLAIRQRVLQATGGVSVEVSALMLALQPFRNDYIIQLTTNRPDITELFSTVDNVRDR